MQRFAPESFSQPFSLPDWLSLAGYPPVVAAGLLVSSGIYVFRRAGTPVDPHKSTTHIVTSGPFRFTRNPLYVSLTLLYLGLTLIFNLAWAMILLPLAVLILHNGVILREERYLAGKFGDEYLAYKSRVRRWL